MKRAYIADQQAEFFKSLETKLEPGTEAIVLLHFSENYNFVMQDEIQSFHWNPAQDLSPYHCSKYLLPIAYLKNIATNETENVNVQRCHHFRIASA